MIFTQKIAVPNIQNFSNKFKKNLPDVLYI